MIESELKHVNKLNLSLNVFDLNYLTILKIYIIYDN